MYDLITLIAALKQVKRPNTFLWNLLVGTIVEETTAKFEIHTKKAKRKVSPFVGKYTNGEISIREGSTISEYEPGKLAPIRVAHANELLERQFGQTIYGDSVSAEDLAIAQVSKELGEMDEEIFRSEMYLIAKLLTTGIMPIKGKTVDRAITFGAINKEVLSGSDLWSHDDSDPIGYLEAKQTEVLKETGILIDSIILTPEVAARLRNHPGIKDMLKYTTADILRINPRTIGNGAKYIGTIPGLELDLYSFVDWYIDPETEKETTFIPEGGIIGVKSKSLKIHYGAHAQKVDGNTSVFVGTRIPKHWSNSGEDHDNIRLIAKPLPVPEDVRGFFYSKVI